MNDIIIGGKKYSAGYIGNNLWMVKRWQDLTSSDDESNYTECQVNCISKDQVVVVLVAIANNSWA